MARINPGLFQRLKNRLRLGDSQVYKRIDKKVRELHVPRDLAAIALAAEEQINISRYSSEEDLEKLRGAASTSPSPLPMPSSGRKGPRRALKKKPAQTRGRGRNVFVVHGRNDRLRLSMFRFLRSIGLKPLEWNTAIGLTRRPSPHIDEILDAAFRRAQAVVVLLSAEDQAKLIDKFVRQDDPLHDKELTGQARQNVIFEAGMAFGRYPRNTVLVQVGQIRPFSDIGGRHVVHLRNSVACRQELITKLQNAGCTVDSSGIDWHREGDFRA